MKIEKNRQNARLLLIEQDSFTHKKVSDLPTLLKPSDVLVVNNASTIPASLAGVHVRSGKKLEMRLAGSRAGDVTPWDPSRWWAVLLGEGSWRDPTEMRGAPPHIEVEDELQFGNLRAEVEEISRDSARLLSVRFKGEAQAVWCEIFKHGSPIQYSYLDEELEIWDQQTLFAGPPAALEPPSASFQLSWKALIEMMKLGIQIVPVTHAAGISSTGVPEIDMRLPLPERSWISAQSADRIRLARESGRRIIAVGSSAARAVEGAGPLLNFGTHVTDIKLGAGADLRWISGLLTGLHEPGSSHLSLLRAFASEAVVDSAYASAREVGYLWHEYGDVSLILK